MSKRGNFVEMLPTEGCKSQYVLGCIDRLLDQATATKKDITEIFVCRGPGPFSGLRVGLAAAQGLSMGLGIPIYGVNRLDVIRHVGEPDCFVITRDTHARYCWDEEGILVSGEIDVVAPIVAGKHILSDDLDMPLETDMLCVDWDARHLVGVSKTEAITPLYGAASYAVRKNKALC